MKTKLVMMVLWLGSVATTQAEDLTVIIKKVNGGGKIRVSLFDSEDNFLKKGKQAIETVDTTDSMTVIFRDVKPGIYAVSAIHDKNGNGQLDKASYGKPIEPYGFSNDARGLFGPPSFEESAFEVKTNQTITINLK